jgi:hypothetical protein
VLQPIGRGQEGVAAATALLEMVRRVAGGMDTKVASANADQLFGLLLKAMDTRAKHPDNLSPEGARCAGRACRSSLSSRTDDAEACFLWQWGPSPQRNQTSAVLEGLPV